MSEQHIPDGEVETVDTRPGVIWQDMWRTTTDTLCECETQLSDTELAYVVSRWRMDPAWVDSDYAAKEEPLWCPLQHGHLGPHFAKLGWADVQWGPNDRLFSPGDWFISWGLTDSAPRDIGQVDGCGEEAEEPGGMRLCSLMAGHSGDCRLTLFPFYDPTTDDWLNLDPEVDPEEEDDAADSTAWFERTVVDAYLSGDAIYHEIAMDWGVSEGAVAKIVRRLTTPKQRDSATRHRRGLVIARKRAETAWISAERERLSRTTEND